MLILIAPGFHLFKRTAFHISRSLSVKNQTVGSFRLFGSRVRRGEIKRQIKAVRSTAFQVDDNNIVRMGSKYLTFILHTVLFENRMGDGIRDIQFTFITGHFSRLVVLDKQIAKRLIILVQTTQPMFADKVGGFVILLRLHQSYHLIEHLGGNFDIFKDSRRFPAIKRVFVQLQLFLVYTAKHHGSGTAVTDRKGFIPVFRRFVIPQDKRFFLLCFRTRETTKT